MPRRHYLITYDISDDRRRNEVFRTLRDHGDHAQYSVFFCELSKTELITLRSSLVITIHQSEDQVIILDLGTSTSPLERGLECLGKPFGPTPNGRVLVV